MEHRHCCKLLLRHAAIMKRATLVSPVTHNMHIQINEVLAQKINELLFTHLWSAALAAKVRLPAATAWTTYRFYRTKWASHRTEFA